MLEFLRVVFCFVAPPILVLWFLLRPFIDKFEKLRFCVVMIFISVVNVLSTVLKRQHNLASALTNQSLYSVFEIGITLLWTILCTRWTIHSLYLKRQSRSIFFFLRYFGVSVWALLAAYCVTSEEPEINRLSLQLLAVAFIWFVAGVFITRRLTAIAISICAPTAYFYFCEYPSYPDSSSNPFSFIHHLIFNVVIVFTSAALDKSRAMLDMFYPNEHLQLMWYPNVLKSLILDCRRLLKGLFSKETNFPAYIIQDLENNLRTLSSRSTTSRLVYRLFSSSEYI